MPLLTPAEEITKLVMEMRLALEQYQDRSPWLLVPKRSLARLCSLIEDAKIKAEATRG